MLVIVEKGIRDGICHDIHRYTKANAKYMKDYDPNTESSYVMYLDVNNPYGWEKLPVDGFKWKKKKSRFTRNFIQNYDDDIDKGYTLEVAASYLKHLQRIFIDLLLGKKQVNQVQPRSMVEALSMNTELRKKAKNYFAKDFFKLINNSVFRKSMQNVRNHRDIKLMKSNKRTNHLGSDPKYHSTKHFSEKLTAFKNK